jgi:hypothetical protein
MGLIATPSGAGPVVNSASWSASEGVSDVTRRAPLIFSHSRGGGIAIWLAIAPY